MDQHTLDTVVRQAIEAEAGNLVNAVTEFLGGIGPKFSALKAEQRFRISLQSLGASLAISALEHADPDLRKALRDRGHSNPSGELCQGPLKGKGMKVIGLQLLVGSIRVPEWTAVCRKCGRHLGAVQEALQAVNHMSAACASAVAIAGVNLSFEKAQAAVEEMSGLTVDDNRVQRTIAALGPRAKEAMAEAPADSAKSLPPKGSQVYVMMDGGRIRTRQNGGEWREPCTALVLWRNEKGGWEKRGISHPLDKSKVLSVLDRWMTRLAPGTDWEVIIIADGAEWIWQWADQYPWAVHILDYYHLKEHVWEAAKALHGEETSAAACWVDRMMARLWRGWDTSTILALDRMKPRGLNAAKKLEALNKLATYLDNHHGLTRYAQNRKAGRCIGSGAIESFCKQLFSMRMKGPGMFWGELGAEHVMGLRTLYLTGQWGRLWDSPRLRKSA
ncbi:MAG: ISKra4 family transposase [Planctomycetes bacterium]|nr:ISKra4 family transposase [Planctomycetota bacterium]